MNQPPAVLVVDDDADLLQLMTLRLQRAGFAVQTAISGAEALKRLSERQPRAVVTDLRMDGLDGLELLAEIESRYPVLPVVLMTAHGTIPDAVRATRLGAYAFLTKPIDDKELIACLRQAMALGGGEARVPGGADSSRAWRAEIITRSPTMESLLRQAELAGASDASILIESASGTGKELLARAIHAASPRSGQPFVTVNCSAIPESLFESEVFGHVKGAFTGAHQDRKGLFQQAHAGTLFLDEVGDMPLTGQVKLLRSLQQQSVRPVGASADLRVDVRVIAATHHDLEANVARGTFREDLYYRLNVIRLRLPTLEQRREDIPLLVGHFLQKFKSDGVATGFSPGAMECLVAASWPGNVRQLANVVQHCVVLCRSALIPKSLVQQALQDRVGRRASFAEARDRFEFEYLSSLLKTTRGNVAQAARLAERNRSEFYKLLKKHALDPANYRDKGDGA
ncbi:MAG: sigma 54-interacting transcriptional regulator [Xanthomonadales bacterium]|nr:sigma 54-interacting transcriptional regulator [Xanthomonadales bacterium]